MGLHQPCIPSAIASMSVAPPGIQLHFFASRTANNKGAPKSQTYAWDMGWARPQFYIPGEKKFGPQQ
jgi:hypothetical protein